SLDYLRALTEALRDEPPEALLVELSPDPPEDLQFPYFEVLLASEIPLWVSYRRGVKGKLGLSGELLSEDAELFGRAAARLEEMGVGAILTMCAPAPSMRGFAPYLRQYTSLPLGVYPNN